MKIRLAKEKDVAFADEIYKNAKAFMAKNGNPDQWSDDYPSGKDVLSGISDGTSYVCEDGGEIVATFYFKVGEDPTYIKIYDGEWLSPAPYAVIHRIAVKYPGRGIIGFIFDECSKLHSHLKIDTHEDNLPMQAALKKAGFKHCGTIYLPNGEPRIAFEKC